MTTVNPINSIQFVEPGPEHGAKAFELVKSINGLETNTCYAYLLLCSHFRATSVVAIADGEVVGFVGGYRPPDSPDALFVWQVGVAAKARGKGLGSAMIDSILLRPHNLDIATVQATVTPDNDASITLFTRLAQRWSASCEVAPYFERSHFSGQSHEPESLFHIGPLQRDEESASMETISRLESNVRGYVRNFPKVFSEATGTTLRDQSGAEFIDFFAGAGALNYGHNNPKLKGPLLDYLSK
ncbi:MAG: diaminobutyrate acetyltransferase, partial [Myxococcales bacterium]|nr:diaminobutyrate acetyltransferase [Myxococcales bacterium]